MWFNMTTHFLLRGRQEHISMLWGDVDHKTTAEGCDYLEFTERATKTRSGATSAARQFPPKMFAQPGYPRCPVAMYQEFKKRRPTDCLEPDSRFYLQVNRSKNPKNLSVWYKNQPMGRDKIGIISKTMSEKAGFEGKKTNHGARRTALVTLTHANIPPNNIIQLSGHRNTLSLNEYSELSIAQQKEMSGLLTNLQKPASDANINQVSSEIQLSNNLDELDENSLNEVMDTIIPRVSVPEPLTAIPLNVPVQVATDKVNVDSFNTQMPNMSLFFGGASIQNVNIYTASSSYMNKEASTPNS